MHNITNGIDLISKVTIDTGIPKKLIYMNINLLYTNLKQHHKELYLL